MNTIVDYESDRFPIPNVEDERRLIRRAQAGDREAEEYMIRANLRFAYQYARNARWSGEQLDDFIQEAAINLSTAIHRFDLSLEHHFITYASWWVRRAASTIRRKTSRVSTPAWALEALSTYQRACCQRGLDPALPETMDQVGRHQKLTKWQRQCLLDLILLQNRDHEPTSTTHHSRDTGSQEPKLDADEAFEALLATDFTDDRIADILRARFGDREETLREIGERYGLSRERVRQLIDVGLKTIWWQSQGRPPATACIRRRATEAGSGQGSVPS